MNIIKNPENLKVIERVIVSGLIFSADGYILMGEKDPSKGGVYANATHIPGGGVEEGESKEEAFVREISEETGLDIKGLTLELVDDLGRGETEKTVNGEKVWCMMQFNIYKVQLDRKADDIVLHPTDDLPVLKWVDPKDLKTINLTQPSVELFKRIGMIEP